MTRIYEAFAEAVVWLIFWVDGTIDNVRAATACRDSSA